MSDLVERLNKVDDWPREIYREAADEIERSNQSEKEGWRYADELDQERKHLRAALEAIVVVEADSPAAYRAAKLIAQEALNPDD